MRGYPAIPAKLPPLPCLLFFMIYPTPPIFTSITHKIPHSIACTPPVFCYNVPSNDKCPQPQF